MVSRPASNQRVLKRFAIGRLVFPIVLFFLTVLPGLTASAAPLQLGADLPYSALIDPPGQLSFEDARQKLRQASLTERATFSRGYVRDTFWLRFELPASVFEGQERWLELGPNFVDDIRFFYRPQLSDAPWIAKRTGDLMQGQSDLDYRKPVLILPPPPSTAPGYEVIVRVQSSSTVILQALLWRPAELFAHSARTTSFWSFYFGLAAISALLATVLALILGGRLLWAATFFGGTYLFVAAIQGYVSWLLPSFGLPLQHYLTSILTLTSYASLLWLCAETVNLKQALPRAYQALIAASGLILSLIVFIPLDRYGTAIRIQTVVYLLAAGAFVFCVLQLWWRERFRKSILLFAACPLICIAGSLFGMLSALGLIPFRSEIYVIWQYALIALMLFVMGIAVYRIREKKLEEFEKRQLAAELKAERDANFHQRQFMGMVSHEFRTPLAVISGSLENLVCLEDGSNSLRAQRYEKIKRANSRLVQLTDNCLADARIAADQLYMDPQPVNLLEEICSAATLVQLSDHHHLTLSIEGKPVEDSAAQTYRLNIDAAMIRIALANVIDNAVKHSPGGNIHIDVSQRGNRSIVRISDEGPGISAQDAGHIFERYRRGAHSRPGNGLGLYIARQISRSHGGDLQLVSTSPEGSCFELTFDQAKDA